MAMRVETNPLEMAYAVLRSSDLAAYVAQIIGPLAVRLANSTIYNLPPPTQGLASLMILGIFERLGITEGEGFAHVHGLVAAPLHRPGIRGRCPGIGPRGALL
ncbi:gamma-glutamyltransferase [Tepidiphilus olei]|uniref:gamma-glutamyltransferase n=1 Tax=Tepidiphilus olei TaxID=2502184 RepID=UPI001C8F5A89|nr:gamma-glutamyltransferase [Tepidiphilus olei]